MEIKELEVEASRDVKRIEETKIRSELARRLERIHLLIRELKAEKLDYKLFVSRSWDEALMLIDSKRSGFMHDNT